MEVLAKEPVKKREEKEKATEPVKKERKTKKGCRGHPTRKISRRDFLQVEKKKEILNVFIKYIFSNLVFAFYNWSMLISISAQSVSISSYFHRKNNESGAESKRRDGNNCDYYSLTSMTVYHGS